MRRIWLQIFILIMFAVIVYQEWGKERGAGST